MSMSTTGEWVFVLSESAVRKGCSVDDQVAIPYSPSKTHGHVEVNTTRSVCQ